LQCQGRYLDLIFKTVLNIVLRNIFINQLEDRNEERLKIFLKDMIQNKNELCEYYPKNIFLSISKQKILFNQVYYKPYLYILGVVKRNPLIFHFRAKIMDFFLLHLILGNQDIHIYIYITVN